MVASDSPNRDVCILALIPRDHALVSPLKPVELTRLLLLSRDDRVRIRHRHVRISRQRHAVCERERFDDLAVNGY